MELPFIRKSTIDSDTQKMVRIPTYEQLQTENHLLRTENAQLKAELSRRWAGARRKTF